MKKQGVLVISHGSSSRNWVEQVDACINLVQLDVPVVASFLEMVENRTIEDGIHQLEQLGVTEIVAIPLFVSSGSTHIEEIRYLLGLEQNPRIPMDEKPIQHRACIRLLAPMNDHPLILDVLAERVHALSTDISNEIILLVGHGSDLPWFQAEWGKVADKIASQLQDKVGAKSISYAFTLPDTLRARLEEESKENAVVLLPLFLSEGYFTRKKIPARVEGLSYKYDGKAYLPHPNVSKWIEAVAQENLSV
ncbi:cobalamin biosynthesis protein CbiX [Shimazuella sp. AN120528]|uniref:sirohydrochlorin chelatase n=1 Tax=Shimazuella soli TaxID=1892854 RepID=UPI001F0D13C6|nr:CbiX/SirB N-terminal domain-containing protein [Shimazuella soli]MCH5586526.1 cobalamin biosynthesis protein CbiX [Shimazuella soli]